MNFLEVKGGVDFGFLFCFFGSGRVVRKLGNLIVSQSIGSSFGMIGSPWMFIVGSAALILIGINSPQFILYSLIAIAGAATIGSQILLYTFVAQFYPTALRSTGMGWASGIGRIGAIIGPVLTGALLSFELPHQMNFLAIAIPGVIAALAIFMVNLKASVAAQTPSTFNPQNTLTQQ